MKKIFGLILCIVGISFAQTSTATTVGNTTYIYNSDGSTATQQRVGNTVYTYGSNGSSSTATTVGNTSTSYTLSNNSLLQLNTNRR